MLVLTPVESCLAAMSSLTILLASYSILELNREGNKEWKPGCSMHGDIQQAAYWVASYDHKVLPCL